MGRYWAIRLWITIQKFIAIVVAIGSVWVFIELERVAAEGVRELSFAGIVIGTDVSTAIHLAPFAILIRGLIYALLLYASAQFLNLLFNLMLTGMVRMRRDLQHYQKVVPQQSDNEIWLERPDLNKPPARQDERAVAARAGGKWDMGSG